MKNLALPLLAAVGLLAAVLGPTAPAHAQGWKTTSTETLPAPAEGIVHHVRTLEKTGPGPASDANGTATPPRATLHFVSFEAARYTFALFDQGASAAKTSATPWPATTRWLVPTADISRPTSIRWACSSATGGSCINPRAPGCSSGALVVTGNHIAIRRSTEPLPGKHARQAVQCGPFLVEGGKAEPGLNNVRSARRTTVFTDGHRTWGLASTTSLTLEELGAILADPALLPGGLKIDRAINLDGGSSTGLWVAQPGQPAPFYVREIGIVRDFVGIVPRPVVPRERTR